MHWSFATGNLIDSSPCVANGVVHIGTFDNNDYALDTHTGSLLWNFTTGAGVTSSLAVARGHVRVGSDDHTVYAFSL